MNSEMKIYDISYRYLRRENIIWNIENKVMKYRLTFSNDDLYFKITSVINTIFLLSMSVKISDSTRR